MSITSWSFILVVLAVTPISYDNHVLSDVIVIGSIMTTCDGATNELSANQTGCK